MTSKKALTLENYILVKRFRLCHHQIIFHQGMWFLTVLGIHTQMSLFSSFSQSRKHNTEAVVCRCFFKISVLKIFQYSHLSWSLFLIKLKAFMSVALLKRDSNTGVFQWILRTLFLKSTSEYYKIFKDTFFYRKPLVAASMYKSQYKKGIGMTKNKNLTLPDIIYLLRDII